MRSFTFRQWVACTAVVTVLFGAVAPRLCACANCPCGHNATHNTETAPATTAPATLCTKCCGGQPESTPEKQCSGKSPEMPCCCDTQKDHAIVPTVISPLKKPNVESLGNIVPVLSVGSADGLRLSCLNNRWALPPPHTPLHIVLCVFLN